MLLVSLHIIPLVSKNLFFKMTFFFYEFFFNVNLKFSFLKRNNVPRFGPLILLYGWDHWYKQMLISQLGILAHLAPFAEDWVIAHRIRIDSEQVGTCLSIV